MLPLSREELLDHLPDNSTVAEIGVDKGEFSKLILEKCSPKHLYLIDPWIAMTKIDVTDNSHSAKFSQVKEMFAQHDNVTIIKKISTEALEDIEDESLDWIYIDGDHSYQGCKQDLDNYDKKVKTDGFICGHDWVTKDKNGFGVNQAVNEFISEKNYILRGLTNEENFKSYVIAKSENSLLKNER